MNDAIRLALKDSGWLSARQIARRIESLNLTNHADFKGILAAVRLALYNAVPGVSRDTKLIPETEESVLVYAILG